MTLDELLEKIFLIGTIWVTALIITLILITVISGVPIR